MSRNILSRRSRSLYRGPGNVEGCTTAAQVMERGDDLSFTVDKRPIAFADTGIVIPDAFGLARHDNRAKLAIVGKDYAILQNADLLAPIDELVAKGALAYHSAGAADGGARIVVKATLPGVAVRPIGDAKVGDTVGAHVMISHGHGGAGITITSIIEALACLNGMRRAKAGGTTHMRHTGDVATRVRSAVLKMDVVKRELDRVATIGSVLTTRGPKDADAVLDYLAAVYQEKAEDLAKTRKAQTIGNMFLRNEMIGAEMETRRGTWWGLYNALTEYLTHDHGRSAETRRDALVWGPNGDLVNRGLDVAYVMGWSDVPADALANLSTVDVAERANTLIA